MSALHRSPITRRQFVSGAMVGAAALALASSRAFLAPASASFSGLASLGLPELRITVTDTAFEGVPEEIPAGRYLLSVINKTTDEVGGGNVAFLSPEPVGKSIDDLLDAIASFQHAEVQPATPPGDNHDGDIYCGCAQLPLWFYQSRLAGGADTSFGDIPHSIVDLLPGKQIVWGDAPWAPQEPTTMTVTGEFPVDVPEPAENIEATMFDFGYSFAGALRAGTHVMRLENRGAEPHQLLVDKGPDSMTAEQFIEMQEAFRDTGKPDPNGLQPEDMGSGYYTAAQSIGVTTWHELTLEQGAYVAYCFYPTAGTGRTHFFKGQTKVIHVEA